MFFKLTDPRRRERRPPLEATSLCLMDASGLVCYLNNQIRACHQLWPIQLGGVGDTALPTEIPPRYHSGFKGCIDVFKMERRRLPISKVALAKGLPPCVEHEDD